MKLNPNLTQVLQVYFWRQNKVADALCGFFQQLSFGVNSVNSFHTLEQYGWKIKDIAVVTCEKLNLRE